MPEYSVACGRIAKEIAGLATTTNYAKKMHNDQLQILLFLFIDIYIYIYFIANFILFY